MLIRWINSATLQNWFFILLRFESRRISLRVGSVNIGYIPNGAVKVLFRLSRNLVHRLIVISFNLKCRFPLAV